MSEQKSDNPKKTKNSLSYSDYVILKDNLIDGKIPMEIVKLMSLWMLNFGCLKGFSKDWKPALGHRIKAHLMMSAAEKDDICKPFLDNIKPYI